MSKSKNLKWTICLGGLVAPWLLATSASLPASADNQNNNDNNNRNAPVSLLTVIPVPGNPITSADISWTDPVTERYYFADRSNFGVDVIDAVTDKWVGRVAGMAGPNPSGGGTSTSNGPGPNGVVVTPRKHLWAGDGNSTVQLADVDPHSKTYLQILKSISTALPACDGGTATTHYCGRADEIDYDPIDHIIMVANNAPLLVTDPKTSFTPYATFIKADPPYHVMGHILFDGAGGLEQPHWDPQTKRFLITVPGKVINNTVTTLPSIHVINPVTLLSEKTYPLDCQAIAKIAGVTIPATTVNMTGIALTPNQHILVSACGFPIILTLDKKTSNVNIIKVINQVGGGDEVWYNPGDGRFYVTGLDMTTTTPPGVQSLGVINAQTSEWLQNVPDVRGKNAAALPANNHIFTIVQITAAIAAGTATDDSICVTTDPTLKGKGCVAVFSHGQRKQGNQGNQGNQ
jgi:hypothetical protein